MVNFGPLAAEIDWWVWGTPANFNGFRVFASLLKRRRSTEVSQTLHDVSPSHIHFWGLLPLTECCQVQHYQSDQVLRSTILAALYCTTIEQYTSAKFCGLWQGRELRGHSFAPPIFCRAAITFGIGPHFSINWILAIGLIMSYKKV